MINFSDKYDRNKFKHFLKDFLPQDLIESNEELKIEENNNYFRKAILLGSVKSLDGLVIIEIERKKSEKSRITITKELFKFLELYGYSQALVVTFSEKESHYRFSLIKSELNWTGTKVDKEFSNPKRLSFLLGVGSKVHTASKHLIKLGKVKDFTDLYARFNIEIINNEFFDHYKNLYLNLKDKLDKDEEFSLFAKQINLETSHFAKKLLGQIIFCYFLQKKGWLGVDQNKSFGTGDGSFFRNQFEKYNKNKLNFFNNFLEFFFYQGLNSQNKNDFVKEINCKVPYIGGGLFEYFEGYNWKKETLKIPNSTFSNTNKDGILDIFELYNFTVDENENIDVEISIDPEMLGRVFENLLEENIRKKGGSFYTPRSIVNFMSEDSMINYLNNKLNDKLSYQQISSFVTDNNFDIAKDKIFKLNVLIIDSILENIKICDPAIGSGAFAVGIVNLISRLRVSLKNFVDRKYKNTSYYFKRHCIQNSIYGVDIDASAVEVTKLRLWLSLIVDEADYSLTEPLPNLDYKIMQGDSLIDEFYGYKFRIIEKHKKQYSLYEKPKEIENLVTELNLLQEKYANLKQFLKRKEIRIQIDKQLIKIFEEVMSGIDKFDQEKSKKLRKSYDVYDTKNKKRSFFCWELFFAEVFYVKKGFDIVLANPPYIEFKITPKSYKEKLVDYLSAKGKYDLYVIFTEKCLELLNDDGIAILIQPTSFLKKDLGKFLRIFLEKKTEILSVHDFNDIQIFSKVTNYTGLFQFKKKKLNNYNFDYHQYFSSKESLFIKNFYESLRNKNNTGSKNFLEINSEYLKNDQWNFQTDETQNKLSLIEKNNKTLKDFCDSISPGIMSGKDEVFYITHKEIKDYKIEKEILKKILKGRDIKAYKINWGGLYVIYPYDKNTKVINESDLKKNFPNTYKYLKLNKEKLKGRDYFDRSSKLWYELWNQRKFSKFDQVRIVVPDISSKCNFALTGEFFGTTTTYHLTPKNKDLKHTKILLALLNTELINYYFKKITTPQRGGFYRYKSKFLEKIPINEMFFKHTEIINLVDEITKIKELNVNHTLDHKLNKNLEEINKIAYKVYKIKP